MTNCDNLIIQSSPTLKWKCSGSPNYSCTQSSDGNYDTEEICKSNCISSPTLKWKCSGSPNYLCTQTSDGNYDTEKICKSNCISSPIYDTTKWNIVGVTALISGILLYKIYKNIKK